ncbi:MAG: ABC transporter ATP-binding protein [Methanomicrobiaceae archaeon]|nr:ABC transporter ATP-binding protein [Methanomicrobiaceae archaeon]
MTFSRNEGGNNILPIVEISHLTKEYDAVTAVRDITLNIAKGELFGLLGPNGSGKTTMIRLLTGQIRPTRGTARVTGLSIEEHPVEIRERVGIIPEQETPPSFLTAEEYLQFVARVRNIPDADGGGDRWFRFLEFEDKKDVLCKDLSRGTRQKLMFAQAFLHQPKLVFIDEPLINLDPIMQRKVKDFLGDYVKDGGTVFLSTHILEIAEEICTRVGIIHQGSILFDGSIGDLRSKETSLEAFFLSLVHQKR